MIKICHMTSAHDSDDARVFRFECSSLAAAGYETYLIARGISHEENGVHVVGLGEAPSSRIKRMTTFAKAVYQKALELDCDVYHLHDPELLPYGLKLKRHGKKVIFDSHENTLEQMDEKTWIPRVFRKAVSSGYRLYATCVFKKMDALISVTPHIIDQLQAINANTWMVTNYPVFVDYPHNTKTDESLALCFTGGIDPQWNHGAVIEALAADESVSYNLCGPCEETYLKTLLQLPMWKNVNYYGKVPFSKAIEIQLSSNIGIALLAPSKNTGGNIGTIGNTKLFEYMMAGLPIICTDFDLWKDIIERWHCGICVNSKDLQAVMDAIRYLKDYPDEARQMGENGRKAVKEEFNWGTQEKKLIKLYESILNE